MSNFNPELLDIPGIQRFLDPQLYLQLVILQELRQMASSIVTRDQFDAALTSAITTITTAIQDLQAKVAAGTVTTPEDFTAELAKISSLTSLASAADPGAAPAPTTTAAITPPSSTNTTP